MVPGGTTLPPFKAAVPSDGFTLFLKPPSGQRFTASIPLSLSLQWLLQLQFCASGAPDKSSDLWLPAVTTMALTGVSALKTSPNLVTDASTVHIVLNDTAGESGMTADGACFVLDEVSVAYHRSYVFLGIILTLQTPSNQPLRHWNQSEQRVYFPRASSAFGASLSTLSRLEKATSDPGPFVSTKDVSPPLFTNCPINGLVAEVSAGQLGANVTWDAIEATDYFAAVTITSSHHSGDFFYLADSPINITYTATNTRGLQSICTFLLVLSYSPRPFAVPLSMSLGSSPMVSEDVFGAFVYTDLLLHYDAAHPLSFAFDAAGYTSLVLNFTDSDLAFTLQPYQSIPTLFEYDLIFAVSGSLPEQPPSKDVYSSFGFTEFHRIDLVFTATIQDSTTMSSSYNYSAIEQFDLEPSPSYTNVFEPGRYLRVSGKSTVFKGAQLLFAGVQITLNFPLGAVGGRNHTYTLVPGSFMGFSYLFPSFSDVNTQGGAPFHTGYAGFLKVAGTTDNRVTYLTCPPNIVADTPLGLAVAVVYWSQPVVSNNFTVATIQAIGSVPMQNDTHCWDTFNIGTVSVLYAVEEVGSIRATCSFDVTIIDNQPPIFSCPPDQELNVTQFVSSVAVPVGLIAPVDVSDNSQAVVSFTSNVSDTQLSIGVHYIQLTGTDQSGNSATCVFIIDVMDMFPPMFDSCPSSREIFVPAGVTTYNRTELYVLPSAVDTSGTAYIYTNVNSSAVLPLGVTRVSVQALDPSGNVAVCTFTITIAHEPSASSASSQGSSVAIGVGVGGAVIVVLVIVAVFVFRTRRKHMLRPHNFTEMLEALDAIESDGQRVAPREIRRTNVKLLDQLGKGNFGQVYKGLLDEIPGTPGYIVAVKTMSLPGADRYGMLQEAALMAQLNHAHVVRLIGVVTMGEPLLVVIEFCEYGSLDGYVKRVQLEHVDKLGLAADCAEGMAYLASRNFVHRDIAARNVLVNSERRGKISDFGMGRELSDDSQYYQMRSRGQVPVRWTALETLESGKFSHESDCWSFGVLLWEIWADARLPYDHIDNWQQIISFLSEGNRLPCPEQCPQDVYAVMLSCWAEVPKSRPNFVALFLALSEMLSHQHSEAAFDADAVQKRQSSGELDFSWQINAHYQSTLGDKAASMRSQRSARRSSIKSDPSVTYTDLACGSIGDADDDAADAASTNPMNTYNTRLSFSLGRTVASSDVVVDVPLNESSTEADWGEPAALQVHGATVEHDARDRAATGASVYGFQSGRVVAEAGVDDAE